MTLILVRHLYNTGPATFGEHFLTVNKKNKDISRKDLLSSGRVVGLSAREMNNYINEVLDNFSDSLKNISNYNLDTNLITELKNNIRLSL